MALRQNLFPPGHLGVAEVARRENRSRAWVVAEIHAGRLEAVRHGNRFAVPLIAFMEWRERRTRVSNLPTHLADAEIR